MSQFLRKWAINIDGNPFIESGDDNQFRIVFDVMVSPQNSQSFADIRIYNSSKNSLITQGSSISFLCGYNDNYGTIFIGTITNVLREREGASTAVRLMCKSGEQTKLRGSISGSFGIGTKITDVIKSLANAWPLELDIDESQFFDSPTFTSGYVADGDIPTILNSLAYQFNFTWTQERGVLTINRFDKNRSTTLYEINQFTGMVGIPEVSKGPDGLGVFVTTKINPFIRSNSRINVKSEYATFNTGNLYISPLSGDANANGEYNVLSMHYSGDSWGQAWDLSIDGLRGTTQTSNTNNGQQVEKQLDAGSLVWGARVDQAFRKKVKSISQSLNIDPNWLMSVMAFETGKSFSPSVQNTGGSSAVGLIQFISSTAVSLGTTTTALVGMTAVDQLDYVEKYYKQYASRIKNIGDAYMAVLWPAAIGISDTSVLWAKTGTYATQYAANAGLDTNHDGTITRGEAVSRVNDMYKQGMAYIR